MFYIFHTFLGRQDVAIAPFETTSPTVQPIPPLWDLAHQSAYKARPLVLEPAKTMNQGPLHGCEGYAGAEMLPSHGIPKDSYIKQPIIMESKHIFVGHQVVVTIQGGEHLSEFTKRGRFLRWRSYFLQLSYNFKCICKQRLVLSILRPLKLVTSWRKNTVCEQFTRSFSVLWVPSIVFADTNQRCLLDKICPTEVLKSSQLDEVYGI